MSILAAVGIGMSIFSGVTGVIGGINSKKEAKKMAKQQKAIAEHEYKINSEILANNFINNALVNYNEIAKQMSNLTTEYNHSRNNAIMSTQSYFTGGASFNSNRENTIAALNLDYNTKVFEYNNLRIYNEETLKKQFSSDMTNLVTKLNNSMYNIGSSLHQVQGANTQQIINSVANAGSGIFGMLGYSTGNTPAQDIFKEVPQSQWYENRR